MGSNQDFSELVFKALKEIDYSGEKDNSRFLAAMQDLAIDYQNEKKFLERNADGRLIQYCGEAINCDEKQISAS